MVALLEKIKVKRPIMGFSLLAVEIYLVCRYTTSDLRADISDLMQLSARQISRFCEAYDTSKSNLLARVMNKLSVGRQQQ